MQFNTTVLAFGNNTGIEVPTEVLEALGGGKRPAVRVTISGETVHTTLGNMRGKTLLSVSAERRKLWGIGAGDDVTVDIEIDTAPPEVAIPPQLAEAFTEHPGAAEAFAALSPSRKKALTVPIADAKGDDTRARRVAKAIEALTAS